MILADTSVWVAHFRQSVPLLQELLIKDHIVIHPWVIGELACGTLPRRPHVLQWLRRMPQAELAHDNEVVTLIEDKHLWGTGIGWIDAHLLASGLITRCELWTRDERLHLAAKKLGLAYLERDMVH